MKRVFMLQIGESFVISGIWRIVVKIDETYLYYNYLKKGNGEKLTLRKNSKMLVKIQDDETAVAKPNQIDRSINKTQSGHYDKRLREDY